MRPLGGIHRNSGEIYCRLTNALERHLSESSEFSTDELLENCYARFRILVSVEEQLEERIGEESEVSLCGTDLDDTGISYGVPAEELPQPVHETILVKALPDSNMSNPINQKKGTKN